MTEQCPFCRSEIPEGAIVCRGCGANKRRVSDAREAVAALIPGALGIYTLTTTWWIVGAILLVGSVLVITWSYRNFKKIVWVRPLR